MTSLESILPLLKLLPALVLEQSTYIRLYTKYFLYVSSANARHSLVAPARGNLQIRFPGILGPRSTCWRVYLIQ